MYRAKSKKVNTLKRSLLLAVLVVIGMFTMMACDSKEPVVTTEEFELVSCYVEFRNKTNLYGGIVRTDEYFHYGYVDTNGKVIFDEVSFSWADFEITEETPKVIITSKNGGKSYTFELTKEMYSKLNSTKE